MRKTINISEVAHFVLNDFCKKTGEKQYSVADKAVKQYIKNNPVKKEKKNVHQNHQS